MNDWVAFRDGHSHALGATDSPLEALLFVALLTVRGVDGRGLQLQHEVAGYRIDIAVTGRGTNIGVEVDGHNFHERTKQQAAHDKSRDRDLTAAGWFLLRFTGSEVYADPIGCARQIVATEVKLTNAATLTKGRALPATRKDRRLQQIINELKLTGGNVDAENALLREAETLARARLGLR